MEADQWNLMEAITTNNHLECSEPFLHPRPLSFRCMRISSAARRCTALYFSEINLISSKIGLKLPNRNILWKFTKIKKTD